MTPLMKQLSNYATYHRDRRNITTHFFGVPMILVSVCSLTSRPAFLLGGVPVSPMWLVGLVVAGFYLRLELRLGLVMSLVLALSGFAGSMVATQRTSMWLATSAALFAVGWVIQFIGHYYEGRKPAFVDDLVGLLIGPLFVTAELGFLLGLRSDLRTELEAIAGPTHLRDLTQSRVAR